jgi:hypothetical protein
MTECTYRKLRTGDWGICGPDLRTGDRVIVRKRDGQARPATVGAIVWTGDDGTTIARIAPETRDPEARAAESEAPRARASARRSRWSRPADDDTARAMDDGIRASDNGPPAWDAPPPSDDDYLTAS